MPSATTCSNLGATGCSNKPCFLILKEQKSESTRFMKSCYVVATPSWLALVRAMCWSRRLYRAELSSAVSGNSRRLRRQTAEAGLRQPEPVSLACCWEGGGGVGTGFSSCCSLKLNRRTAEKMPWKYNPPHSRKINKQGHPNFQLEPQPHAGNGMRSVQGALGRGGAMGTGGEAVTAPFTLAGRHYCQASRKAAPELPIS